MIPNDPKSKSPGIGCAIAAVVGMILAFGILVIIAFIIFASVLINRSHTASDQENDIVAEHVITVADDFCTDVYHNGKKIPASSRHQIGETFGAEQELDDIVVKKGDWLVFHVVNNSIRWNGTYFFAAAGFIDREQLTFVSDQNSSDWSYCDDNSEANSFITDRCYLCDNRTYKIPDQYLWRDGIPLMKKHAGDSWNGTPLWGPRNAHSVWIKVLIN